MEKQRITRAAGTCRRLLILAVLLLCTNAYSQVLTYSVTNKLRLKPVQPQLYTGEDITFEVIVPYTKPSQTVVSIPSGEDWVTFKSMKTFEATEEETRASIMNALAITNAAIIESGNGTVRTYSSIRNPVATKIEVVFNFERKGTYTLDSLTVDIKGVQRIFKFDPVVIKKNPKDQYPAVVIQFDADNDGIMFSSEADNPETNTGVKKFPAGKAPKVQSGNPLVNPAYLVDVAAGQKLKMRVYIQYGVNLVQFNWGIPKDSIFTKIRDYEITEIKYREKEYSEALIPVADFEWTPLNPGEIAFPDLKVTVVGYNGYKNEATLPAIWLNVQNYGEGVEGAGAGNGSGYETSAPSFYNDVFDYVDDSLAESVYSEITLKDCIEIQEMRRLERYSVIPRVRMQREQLEQSLGLPYDKKEFCMIYLYIAIAVSAFFIFLLFICIKKRKIFFGIFTGTLIICSFVIIIVSAVVASQKYGICTGCEIKSIPAENAATSSSLDAGCRVHIIEEADEWIYVEYGNISGWCLLGDVLWI